MAYLRGAAFSGTQCASGQRNVVPGLVSVFEVSFTPSTSPDKFNVTRTASLVLHSSAVSECTIAVSGHAGEPLTVRGACVYVTDSTRTLTDCAFV